MRRLMSLVTRMVGTPRRSSSRIVSASGDDAAVHRVWPLALALTVVRLGQEDDAQAAAVGQEHAFAQPALRPRSASSMRETAAGVLAAARWIRA